MPEAAEPVAEAHPQLDALRVERGRRAIAGDGLGDEAAAEEEARRELAGEREAPAARGVLEELLVAREVGHAERAEDLGEAGAHALHALGVGLEVLRLVQEPAERLRGAAEREVELGEREVHVRIVGRARDGLLHGLARVVGALHLHVGLSDAEEEPAVEPRARRACHLHDLREDLVALLLLPGDEVGLAEAHQYLGVLGGLRAESVEPLDGLRRAPRGDERVGDEQRRARVGLRELGRLPRRAERLVGAPKPEEEPGAREVELVPRRLGIHGLEDERVPDGVPLGRQRHVELEPLRAELGVGVEARHVGAEGGEDLRALDVLGDLVEARLALLDGEARVVLERAPDRGLDERRELPAEEREDLLRPLRALDVLVLGRGLEERDGVLPDLEEPVARRLALLEVGRSQAIDERLDLGRPRGLLRRGPVLGEGERRDDQD